LGHDGQAGAGQRWCWGSIDRSERLAG
jgi:hypothetical protein